MCWSGQASFTLAAFGFAGAFWAQRKGHPITRWLPLCYFSGMETLQGITYSVIGDCGRPTNMVLTYISYIHIAFQPFFSNMIGLSWQSPETRQKSRWIWGVCILTAVVMLAMPFFPTLPWACDPLTQTMCGMNTCSYKGEWHIAWRLPLSNLDPNYLSYYLAVFLAPLFYGGWRWATYHLLMGPVLARFLTSNKDERPAIWCLMSIAFLVALHIPFIERLIGGSQAHAEKKDALQPAE